MKKDFQKEQTLVLIKPDAVKRGLTGEIIRRIEQTGLKIVAMKMFQATLKDLERHYPKTKEYFKSMGEKTLATYSRYGFDPVKEMGTSDPERIGELVHGWLLNFMTSGPIIKILVEGLHSVTMVRKIVGNTMPAEALTGTIRGDFSVDSAVLGNLKKRPVRNLIHASGTVEEAEQEIKLWFTPEEIHEYKRADEDTMF